MGVLDAAHTRFFGKITGTPLTIHMLIELYWMSDHVHRPKLLRHTSFSGAHVTWMPHGACVRNDPSLQCLWSPGEISCAVYTDDTTVAAVLQEPSASANIQGGGLKGSEYTKCRLLSWSLTQGCTLYPYWKRLQ